MNLHTRFFLVLNGLGLAILAAFSLSLYLLGYRQILSDQEGTRTETLAKVASVCGEAFIDSNDIAAINYFKLLRREPGVVAAGCLNSAGRVHAHTNPVLIGETIPPAKAESQVHSVLGKTHLELTRRVQVRGEDVGFAVVQYDEAFLRLAVRRRLLHLMRGIAGVCAVVLFTVVLGGSTLLAKSMTSPISALEAASVEFGKGNFAFTPSVAGRKDEVGRLARSLTAMAGRLSELDALKQRFLEHITHDLRQPLTAIGGYSEMLLEGLLGPVTPKQAEKLKIIQDNSQRLAAYIDDILDAAKLEAGGMALQKKSVALGDVLRSVEELFAGSAAQYGIRLETRCEPGLPEVQADPDLLCRAVTNLVGNALKFTPKEGAITAQASRDGPAAVRVSVSDTGPGIPKDKIERVFDKFFQVTETKGQARKVGTGLGLTITRDIVAAHGGRIWAESEPGRGTTFVFTLPVASAISQGEKR